MSLLPFNAAKSPISPRNTNIIDLQRSPIGKLSANLENASGKVVYSETYHTYDKDGRLQSTRQAKFELEHSAQRAVISNNLKAPEKTVAKSQKGSITKVPSTTTLKTPTLATKANTTISKPAPTLPVKTIGSGATAQKLSSGVVSSHTTTSRRSISVQSTSSTVNRRSVTGRK